MICKSECTFSEQNSPSKRPQPQIGELLHQKQPPGGTLSSASLTSQTPKESFFAEYLSTKPRWGTVEGTFLSIPFYMGK